MFTPLDILIMSVFHPPREKIQRVLKNWFSKSSVSKSQRQFIDLVDLGSQLREIHLLESETEKITSQNHTI
jgi:hypothetical protein